MPKQLINTVGLLVVLGVLAAATFFVALPIYLQSVGANAQTSAVAGQNAATQAEIDSLAAQDVDAVTAGAEELRAQIPDEARLDSVSSLITSAADSTKVIVVNFTPGIPVSVSTTVDGADSSTDAGTDASDDGTTTPESADAPVTGQVEIPVEFQVSGPDLPSVLAFLDTLREGPRLLGDLDVTFISRGGVTNANVKAHAFAATTAN